MGEVCGRCGRFAAACRCRRWTRADVVSACLIMGVALVAMAVILAGALVAAGTLWPWLLDL